MQYIETSGKLDRARAQVAKEDQRKRERAAKKAAAAQRKREGET
jgi:hypothetical protein